MNKISKFIENYYVEKNAKKYWRSFNHQEFRDRLAKTLKTRRKEEQKNREKVGKQKHMFIFDGKPSSREMLEDAKKTQEYKKSSLKHKKSWKKSEKSE